LSTSGKDLSSKTGKPKPYQKSNANISRKNVVKNGARKVKKASEKVGRPGGGVKKKESGKRGSRVGPRIGVNNGKNTRRFRKGIKR